MFFFKVYTRPIPTNLLIKKFVETAATNHFNVRRAFCLKKTNSYILYWNITTEK